tara:strand:+ start:1384 stop:1878 length:495 start_codon:yes stop_codon:yes gene_type:complete
MGILLSGIQPKINKEPSKQYTKLTKLLDKDLGAFSDLPESAKTDYYDERHTLLKANPGIEYACNWWWWRPIWTYVCKVCDFLDEDDRHNGNYNDGHFISKSKARKIASVITYELLSGHAEMYKAARDAKAEKENDEYIKMYPFTMDELIIFRNFCRECGGFRIW